MFQQVELTCHLMTPYQILLLLLTRPLHSLQNGYKPPQQKLPLSKNHGVGRKQDLVGEPAYRAKQGNPNVERKGLLVYFV